MFNDLKKFLMKGNVVDLAVAVVIGAAFGAVINSFVDDIINPLIAAVFGQPDISEVLTWVVREGAGEEADAVLSIGSFLQAVLNFLIIGSALFVVVRAYNKLEDFRASGDATPEETPAPSDEVILLTEIRDALQTRA